MLLAVFLTAGASVALAPASEAAALHNTIRRGQSIGYHGTYSALTSRTSSGAKLRLGVSTAGNLILKKGTTPLWSSKTRGKKVTLKLQKNGNLILRAGKKVIKNWKRHDITRLVLKKNATLVAVNKKGKVVWKTKLRTAATRTAVKATVTSRTATLVATLVEKTIANSVLLLMNVERALHGRAPLKMNAYLIKSARTHNLTMAKANQLSHQLSGEPAFNVRISNAGYDYSWAGENIGVHGLMNQTAALELQKMMYNEGPNDGDGLEHGHYENIIRREFTQVGVDVYLDTRNHALWLTEDFGRPA